MSKFLIVDELMNTLVVPGTDKDLSNLVRNHYTEAETHDSRNKLNKAVDKFLADEQLKINE